MALCCHVCQHAMLKKPMISGYGTLNSVTYVRLVKQQCIHKASLHKQEQFMSITILLCRRLSQACVLYIKGSQTVGSDSLRLQSLVRSGLGYFSLTHYWKNYCSFCALRLDQCCILACKRKRKNKNKNKITK